MSFTDKEIDIGRRAILRIANITDRDERIRELEKYDEPLRGAIRRGVEKIFRIVQDKKRRRHASSE